MTLLDLPGNYGITHYADAVRVGDHHGTVEEARFFDPGCAGHLAIAVFGKPSGEDTVGGIAATRQDCGYAGAYRSDANFQRALAWGQRGVTDFDALNVGDCVQWAG